MVNDNAPKRPPSKHMCMDCKNIVRVPRHEQWRAARPKCSACGSSRLEPVEKVEKA